MIITDLLSRLTFGRALIIGFSITAFYYFMMFDDGGALSQTAANSQSQIQAARAEISALQVKIDKGHEFQAATDQLGDSIDRLLEFLPSGFRVGEFMKTLSTEARIAGLQIQRVAPSQTLSGENVPEFNELGVGIEVRGQFSQVLKFMASLTQKKQIFIYQNLRLTQEAGVEGQNGLLVMNAEVRAYDYIGAAQNASN